MRLRDGLLPKQESRSRNKWVLIYAIVIRILTAAAAADAGDHVVSVVLLVSRLQTEEEDRMEGIGLRGV